MAATAPTGEPASRLRVKILSLPVDVITREQATQRIADWALAGESRSVFCAPVHLCMEVEDRPALRQAAEDADLVTPDGRPLYWLQRFRGYRQGEHVRGPDLTLDVCAIAAAKAIPVGFIGSTERTQGLFIAALQRRFPRLRIDFADPTRQGEMTPAEDDDLCRRIEESGARILFVGLGCPRQERWIGEHRGKLRCVMLGVGAAFDFIAGTKAMAPRWMQRAGLEWLFRLATEPRRLWRRYLILNTRFLWRLMRS